MMLISRATRKCVASVSTSYPQSWADFRIGESIPIVSCRECAEGHVVPSDAPVLLEQDVVDVPLVSDVPDGVLVDQLRRLQALAISIELLEAFV
jgi:hypothetical protein